MIPVTDSLLKIRKQIIDLVNLGIYNHPVSGKKIFSGYEDKILFDWDQYFEAIIQIYSGFNTEMIINGVTSFLDNQKSDGLIPRTIPKLDFEQNEHSKPFFAQIAMMVYNQTGSLDWLTESYYIRLSEYLGYWMNQMDSNKNGLSEWMSSVHTGMDNQHERAGYWNDRFCEGVDLNSYLYREFLAFSKISGLLGKNMESRKYEECALKLKEKILEEMWDDSDGFFYDIDMRTNQKIKVKSVSSFMPLWSKIAAPEQAKIMIYDHLLNSNEFWTPYPVSAMAKSEKGYSQTQLPGDIGLCNWRANTWISTNYMIYHGLKNYGYNELASLIAYKTSELLKKSGSWEFYNTETGKGIKQYPFYGWSLLGYFLDYEEETGYDITRM
jgi:putative isomerase